MNENGLETLHVRRSVSDLLPLFRQAVRDVHLYHVPLPEGITVKLNQNESPHDLPEALKARIAERLKTTSWNRYPSDYADPLREVMAERLGVRPDQVLFSNGSNDLINSVGLALIDPGTPVVLMEPMFSLYKKAVTLYGGRTVPVRCDAAFQHIAEPFIEAATATGAPLVILTRPNSPTGQVVPIDEVERIAAEVPGFVLVDEAYQEFMDSPSALDLLDAYPNVLIMRTFSKALGLAGLRLGYLVAHPEVLQEVMKVRLPFVINLLTEAAALEVLSDPGFIQDHLARIKQERGGLEGALRGIKGVHVVSSETNFLIFRTPLPSAELLHRLARQGVLIRDVGGYPGLDGFVRVSVGTSDENQAFLFALNRALRDRA